MRIEQYFEVMFQGPKIDRKLGRAFFPFMQDWASNINWIDLNEGTVNYGKVYNTDKGEISAYIFNSLKNMSEVILEYYY